MKDLTKCDNVIDDKEFSNFNLKDFSPTDDDTITFSESGGLWVVSTNFGNATQVLTPGTLTYDVTISNSYVPAFRFNAATVASDPNLLNTGTTSIETTVTGIANSLKSLGSGKSTVINDADTFVNPTYAISVSSVFKTTETSSLQNFSFKFNQDPNFVREVPGPLPLLGAGAAFGFSRRLRRRVKASA